MQKTLLLNRPVAPTLEVGQPWKGGAGVLPREKFQKLKPIANISGHLVPFQCNYNERLLILQQTKKTLRLGTLVLHYLPTGKISKIEANLQAFPGIWCHFSVL